MEWTDGIFTGILRSIVANQRGESKRRHWILFDGDVDPEWAENLNSVLDDNKLLTLPSGERLSIPDNVRIMLEVDSLKEATPATVSRCGMLWFTCSSVTNEMCVRGIVNRMMAIGYGSVVFMALIRSHFETDGIVNELLEVSGRAEQTNLVLTL